ncbi:flagellar basal body-associated protein FliL [Magnetospirillum sulfuroxidans]
MIRLVFIIIAFLLMMGGLVGGLYFWGIDPLEKFNSLIGNAPAAPGGAAKVVTTPPSFVEYGLLSVPVIEDHEVRRQVEIILRLEVPFEKREIVAQNIPRLQNAYLQDMMEYLPIHLRNGRRLDPVGVSQRLLKLSERTLGPGFVKGVLIDQSSVK